MQHLTKQERIVLLCLAAVLFCGYTMQYLFQRYPNIHKLVNFMDSDSSYMKIDVNKATKEELVAIPYIGEYTAENIVRYRQDSGPILVLDDLKKIKGIKEKNFERFKKYLKAPAG